MYSCAYNPTYNGRQHCGEGRCVPQVVSKALVLLLITVQSRFELFKRLAGGFANVVPGGQHIGCTQDEYNMEKEYSARFVGAAQPFCEHLHGKHKEPQAPVNNPERHREAIDPVCEPVRPSRLECRVRHSP